MRDHQKRRLRDDKTLSCVTEVASFKTTAGKVNTFSRESQVYLSLTNFSISYNTSNKQPTDQACAGQPSRHGAPPALVISGKLRQGEEVISTLCLARMLLTRTIVCSSPFGP